MLYHVNSFIYSIFALIVVTLEDEAPRCPQVYCSLECKEVIIDKCPKCQCDLNPCKDIRCRPGSECVSYERQCIQAPCPVITECLIRNATCNCHGDPHCQTFDGAGFWDYQGTCEYILTQAVNFQPMFAVYSKNQHLGSNVLVSYVQYVRVTVYNDNIRMETISPQSSQIIVKVNGNNVMLPYIASTHRVDAFLNYVRLTTNFGLVVEYTNYYSVNIILPAALQGLVEGYCGNFNNNATDDSTDRAGAYWPDVGRSTGAVLGTSWVNYVDQKCEAKTMARVIPHECPSVRWRCEQIVNVNGIFRQCIDILTLSVATNYFDSCVFDAGVTCNDEIVCATMQAFAQQCRAVGVVVAWREATYCPCKCDDPNASCSPEKVLACPATCEDPLRTRPCPETLLADVCTCNPGYVLFGRVCVPRGNCGCLDETGSPRKIGEEWLSSNCSTMQKCESAGVGGVTSWTFACPSKTVCNSGVCSDPCNITKCKDSEVCKIECVNPLCNPPITTCVPL